MDKKALFDKVTLSCLSHLDSFENTQLSDFSCGDGALTHEILMWDKKNAPYKLPKDMKNFYSMFNGVNINWSVVLNSEKSILVGELQLNRLELIQRANPGECVFQVNQWKDVVVSPPDLKTSVVFLLHSVNDIGEVYLLYRQPPSKQVTSSSPIPAAESEFVGIISQAGLFETPEVWFSDISSRWHFVTQTFTQYLRLMVSHLGVIGWQLAFTPEGLSDITKQWMTLFCKERLMVDTQWNEKLVAMSAVAAAQSTGAPSSKKHNSG